MLKTKNHGKHILIAICSFLFIMTSCETTRNISVVPQEPTLITYNEDKNVVIDDKTFLFIRTYDPHYNNPLYKQNIFKGLINFAEVNDVAASHVSQKILQISGFELKRRFFTAKENRNIKTLKPRKGSLINNEDEKEFHCASFVAYVLINSVENIKDFFDSRELNYNQLSPSDITQIPGIQKLFSSTWGDYNKVAEKFIEEQADTYIERILGQQ